MTTSLVSLLLLFAEPPSPPPATPAAEGAVEITITGPAGSRAKMEETVRALVGSDPEIRWTFRDDAPAPAPVAISPEGDQRFWIDLGNPVQVRIHLPGCAGATNNVRTVDHPASDEVGPVERETVAQIVKAALKGLRGEPAAARGCDAGKDKEKVVLTADVRRRSAGAVWAGMGGGVAWGYVPSGNLEWERHIEVASQAEWAGLLHLLPEVGYMLTDDFALAVQGRVEFIRQEQATVHDPSTGQVVVPADSVAGLPHARAYAGFLRAIWYRNLSSSGKLRLSFSGDLGGGVVRFPVAPVAVVYLDANGDTQVDWNRTIARTDTRPVGILLFGGSVGLLWHLRRNLALAVDGRALSGLPDWGFVMEAQLSAQVAFGGAGGRVVSATP